LEEPFDTDNPTTNPDVREPGATIGIGKEFGGLLFNPKSEIQNPKLRGI
jgi:hypothetical protein